MYIGTCKPENRAVGEEEEKKEGGGEVSFIANYKEGPKHNKNKSGFPFAVPILLYVEVLAVSLRL